MRRLWVRLLVVFILTIIHSVWSASPLMGRRHVHLSWLRRRHDDSSKVIDANLPTENDHRQVVGDGQSFYSVAYYPAWSLYHDYYPADLPVERLTHVFYSFAGIDEDTGKIFLEDKWAALQAPAVRDESGPGKGILGELYRLKQQNRHLKVVLSIGGWMKSPALRIVVNDAVKRGKLVQTATNLVKELSLDGIDIDWEYADTSTDVVNVVSLLRELRISLDGLAVSQKVASTQYDLVYALPAGPHQRALLDIKEMEKYLTFWNLMAYDFSGSWTKNALYHSNLYNGSLSTDDAVSFYGQKGIDLHKMVLGMPLYGRGFSEATGLNGPHEVIDRPELVDGTIAYRKLPLPSTEEIVDKKAMSVYCYDAEKKLLITYDNPFVSREKAKYVRAKGLAGGMWWEVSQDSSYEQRSLIKAFTDEIGLDTQLSRTNNLFLNGQKPPKKVATVEHEEDEGEVERLVEGDGEDQIEQEKATDQGGLQGQNVNSTQTNASDQSNQIDHLKQIKEINEETLPEVITEMTAKTSSLAIQREVVPELEREVQPPVQPEMQSGSQSGHNDSTFQTSEAVQEDQLFLVKMIKVKAEKILSRCLMVG